MSSPTLWLRSLPAALVLALLSPPAPAADVAVAKSAAQGVADARVSITVIEDDSTHIEETRVRGQTQKVTVQAKNSKAPSYEIIMGDGSRDLSDGPGSTRGAAGKRVWNIFNF
jgi:hypothetical protein